MRLIRGVNSRKRGDEPDCLFIRICVLNKSKRWRISNHPPSGQAIDIGIVIIY